MDQNDIHTLFVAFHSSKSLETGWASHNSDLEPNEVEARNKILAEKMLKTVIKDKAVFASPLFFESNI